MIFVMERKHQQILTRWSQINDIQLIVLEIEDNNQFSDPKLINILKNNLQRYL
jgi:predicted protein tyrosine phosphatase